jgi:hypothetical protein
VNARTRTYGAVFLLPTVVSALRRVRPFIRHEGIDERVAIIRSAIADATRLKFHETTLRCWITRNY